MKRRLLIAQAIQSRIAVANPQRRVAPKFQPSPGMKFPGPGNARQPGGGPTNQKLGIDSTMGRAVQALFQRYKIPYNPQMNETVAFHSMDQWLQNNPMIAKRLENDVNFKSIYQMLMNAASRTGMPMSNAAASSPGTPGAKPKPTIPIDFQRAGITNPRDQAEYTRMAEGLFKGLEAAGMRNTNLKNLSNLIRLLLSQGMTAI